MMTPRHSPYRIETFGWPRLALLAAILLLPAMSGKALGQGASWGGVPVVQPIMPPDSHGSSQSAFNNLAWQQFITLNWAADPASPGTADTNVPPSQFGTPGDTSPVVWETFKEASEVFQTNALPPTAWTATRTLPAAFGATQKRGNLKATSRFGLKGLYGTSKFAGGPALDLTEFSEAAPNGAWLTAQALMKNHLTLFEKRMNEDEFNYVVSNRLYNAANQAPFALTNGINLPDGSAAFLSYGTVGAIEIKGAWIELDDPTLWPLFKISQAYVSYPTTNGMTVPRLATVGLVALHIIRKTPNAQQFVWSTFEHVNNSPSTSDLQNQTLKAWYTYYSANCVTNSDYYGCQWNRAPSPGTDPYDAPVQVVRTTPISTSTANNIALLNSNVWKTIAAASSNSVFLNYQLVNVLWPNANTSIGPAATVPLTTGNAQPPEAQQPVANSVLETYMQNHNCLFCHAYGSVAATNSVQGSRLIRISRSAPAGGAAASKSAATQASALASDYSFLFGDAQMPPAASEAVIGK